MGDVLVASCETCTYWFAGSAHQPLALHVRKAGRAPISALISAEAMYYGIEREWC